MRRPQIFAADYVWCNEPCADSCNAVILRHAWLSPWNKHMTTGRINQISIVVRDKKRSHSKNEFCAFPIISSPLLNWWSCVVYIKCKNANVKIFGLCNCYFWFVFFVLVFFVDLFFGWNSLKCGDNQVPISVQPSFDCCAKKAAEKKHADTRPTVCAFLFAIRVCKTND